MAKDERRAYNLFGKPADFVRGKMAKQAVKRAIIDDDLVLKEKNLVLYSDVMHIESIISWSLSVTPFNSHYKCT